MKSEETPISTLPNPPVLLLVPIVTPPVGPCAARARSSQISATRSGETGAGVHPAKAQTKRAAQVFSV
ncbi:hypothetical protein [Octadecabacter dasysiphoniae]|uniref:hypothetical protein n=1 Tax=Octadecabacter dasysiphoniae TaxID=2909341 RepID=UPI00300D322B